MRLVINRERTVELMIQLQVQRSLILTLKINIIAFHIVGLIIIVDDKSGVVDSKSNQITICDLEAKRDDILSTDFLILMLVRETLGLRH